LIPERRRAQFDTMAACQQQPQMMYPPAGGYAGGNGAMGGAGGGFGSGGAVAGGAGAGGAAGGGCAAVCCAAGGGGAMSFVGQGAGDYTMETTYRYVGPGGGEFGHVAPKKNCFAVVICGGSTALLIALIVLLLLLFRETTTTTTMKSAVDRGECLVWGDPHVQTWDGAFTSPVTEGEYYLVKTETFSIQALCLATPFTEGLAATHEIAIGGSDLKGHTIRVGPMEGGKILIDGQPALTSFPSSQDIDGAAYLSYNSAGNLVDKAQGDLEKHVVHINLENGHSIQVMRWANHINVRIFTHFAEKLRSLTDGLCGNFNKDPSDDTPELVASRNAANVADRDCMFDHRGSFRPAPTHNIEECKRDVQRYNKAVEICSTATTPALKEGCVFDVCFAGSKYAAQMGLQA